MARAPKKKSKVEKGNSSGSGSNIAIERFRFKVENKTDYRNYVELLREQFIDPNRVMNGVPLLPQEKEPTRPADFLEVHLQTDESGVVLLIRRDNVYLVGFKAENSTEYYELKEKKEESVIPSSIGSIWSGFSDSYLKLASIKDLTFHEGTIRESVDLLAKFAAKMDEKNTRKADNAKKKGESSASKGENSGEGRVWSEDYKTQVKKAVVKLIISICEAIRLQRVETFVANQLQQFESKTFGSQDLDVDVHMWATWSRKILGSVPPLTQEVEELRRKIKLLKPSLEVQYP